MTPICADAAPAVRARGPHRALELHARGVTDGAGKLGGMGRGKKYARLPSFMSSRRAARADAP